MDTTTIQAMGAVTVLVIGAIVTGAVKIIGAIKDTKQTVQDVVVPQNAQLKKIQLLVDGRYGQVLQELADVKRILALESGRKADMERADTAQKIANNQKQVAQKAEELIPDEIIDKISEDTSGSSESKN